LRRATRYLTGEAIISGYRIDAPPEAPPGYQGRHAGTEDVSTGEALIGLRRIAAEETGGIRRSRNPRESVRESDEVIVPLEPEDNITSGEGRTSAVGVVRLWPGAAYCESYQAR
jgi:hypothetical protein